MSDKSENDIAWIVLFQFDEAVTENNLILVPAIVNQLVPVIYAPFIVDFGFSYVERTARYSRAYYDFSRRGFYLG
ncbi:hypothetical protein [Cellvibrio fibrivorans]|uniref:Uncharacterized protein n=1 Tax=Cellvibrio fibrivorans TaxID=126350 RepID=A0ABU1UXQ3_9GAMM|nr:hypothetical protein [Cellvibrio fibrivorans]MDR7089971.1 hypothetical protein [Cellvibrio fibrivorans]